MRTDKTIAYYNENAKEYCDATRAADMSHCRNQFLKYLEPGSHILDAGCGSGRDSKYFIDRLYKVTAIDAAEQICAEAEKLLRRSVRCVRFEELEYRNIFDGIWACASLVHLNRKHLNVVLSNFNNALCPRGILYASFKHGEGEAMVGDRYYSYYNEKTLTPLLSSNGFDILEMFYSEDVMPGREQEVWVNIIAKRHDKFIL